MAHFGSIFSNFWGKKNFLEYLALSRTTSYGFLAPCQNLEKVNDTIQRKQPDRRKAGLKDRQKDGLKDRQKDRRTNRPYFIGPFQLLLGVQKRFEWSKTLLLRFPSLDKKSPPSKIFHPPYYGQNFFFINQYPINFSICNPVPSKKRGKKP